MGTVLVIPITIWLVILSGLVPVVRPPASAVRDLSALGVATRDIRMTSQEVNEVANSVNVSEEVVWEVVPQVDQMRVWRQTVQRAIELRQIELKEQARQHAYAVSVGVACDAFLGEIQSRQELVDSLAEQVYGLTQAELEQLVTDTIELYAMWRDASTDDDYNRAVVGTFCWYLQHAR
jgi:hypothetical protein